MYKPSDEERWIAREFLAIVGFFILLALVMIYLPQWVIGGIAIMFVLSFFGWVIYLAFAPQKSDVKERGLRVIRKC